jgi:hypothetical protein
MKLKFLSVLFLLSMFLGTSFGQTAGTSQAVGTYW